MAKFGYYKGLHFRDMTIRIVCRVLEHKEGYEPFTEMEIGEQLAFLDRYDFSEGNPEYHVKLLTFIRPGGMDHIYRFDITRLDGHMEIAQACQYMASLYDIFTSQEQEDPIPQLIDVYGLYVAEKAWGFIGYWQAKLTEKDRRHRGAETMKIKGNKNKEAIGKALKKFGIPSLTQFRYDKNLREKFYQEAAEATKEIDTKWSLPLSPKRIGDIAREILMIPDTKPKP